MDAFSVKAILQGQTPQLTQLFACLSGGDAEKNQAFRARFMTELCAALSQSVFVHPKLNAYFADLLAALCAQSNSVEPLIAEPSHPLWHTFKFWFEHGIHWHENDSKTNEQFRHKLSALNLALEQCLVEPKEQWHPLASALQLLEKEAVINARRANLAEARLCETEVSEYRALRAECQVLDLLNTQLQGCFFPKSLETGLFGTLKHELLHAVLTAGEQDVERLPFWQFWQRQLYLLAQIFSADGVKLSDQALYSELPAQLEKLEKSLSMNTVNPQAYELWVEALSECLMATVQKQSIECFSFSALAYPDSRDQQQISLTPSFWKQLEDIKVGDWFYFQMTEGLPLAHALRCKLALKHQPTNQLLFVDRQGRKVMHKSMKDFALCLSTKISLPIVCPQINPVLIQVLSVWVAAANARLVKVKQKKALVQQQAKADQKLLQAQAAATLRRQEAAKKARSEAQAIKDKAESAISEQLLKKSVEKDLTDLQVGAWLALKSADGQSIRCKLSVIIQSTGKYILVDQLGRKHSEMLKAELQDLLEKGDVTVLHKGNNFEDQLAKVIQGLRR